MEMIIFWLGLSFVAGALASNKGRSFWGFFLLSLFLTPIIGLLAAAVAGKDQSVIDKKALSEGQNKKCPKCAEIIKKEAVKCRFCGSEV